MSLEIVDYSSQWEAQWDEFCQGASNSTFLHTRRFLSYHGERFVDASVILLHEGRVVAVLPAAVSPQDSTTVVSHPGATFGGWVHQGWLLGERMIEAFEAARRHYGAKSHARLIYKAVPYIYAAPASDDLYALFRLDARRVRCELSCAIDSAARRAPSERRKRGLKKATKVVTLSRDTAHLPALWAVVEQNLQSKHEARPVHTLAELADLMRRFPEDIRVFSAIADEKVEAGIVLFNSNRVWHSQYIASSERGYSVSALDAVFEDAIAASAAAGARYFDFGTSNREAGRVLNEGLYRFKTEFGGGGVAHEIYELSFAGR